jgi:uncharacterized protein YecE (DUF72 family)
VRKIDMNTWVGTSGFQYAEWKGNFYPEDLSAAKMLPYYAERLNTTEINYTFHRIPAAKTIDNWNKLTPPTFRFALKAPQKITHWSKLRECGDTMRYFHDVISGLGEKLGPILFQLPPNFQKDTFVLADFVNCLPTGARAAFEFRHESWFADDVWEIFKSRNVALCLNETADFAAPKISTADYGYLRLRREDYSKIDIERWADYVREQRERWTDAFIYFKHEEAGVGPKFARQMVELLV